MGGGERKAEESQGGVEGSRKGESEGRSGGRRGKEERRQGERRMHGYFGSCRAGSVVPNVCVRQAAHNCP